LSSKTPDPTRQLRPRLALAVLLLLPVTPSLANRDTELEQLRLRIERLQQEFEETRGERDEAREQLRDTERRIGRLIREQRSTDSRIRKQTDRLAGLQKAQARTQRELATHRHELEAAMRQAFTLGRQEPLKLLLSQDDPARASRMLTYYRYLAEARATRITSLTDSLARLEALETSIREHRTELASLRQQQAEQKRALDDTRARRRTALTHLNRQVRDRSQEIDRLRRDEERLTRLIRGLRTVLPPTPPVTARPPTSRGSWPLPVKGRLVARYGQSMQIGDLRWRGLFLATREGQPVRAVTGGRVAYADWLRGFGLLLVLDHGQGLMTLYGHNQSLVKNVGDPVESGETVALSGNTGGPPEPGLYFEVRQNGEPRNPLDWCKL